MNRPSVNGNTHHTNGAAPKRVLNNTVPIKGNQPQRSKSIKDYYILIRQNLFIVAVISLVVIALTVLYVLYAKDIYSNTTSLKISKPQGSILTSKFMPDFQDFGMDRFISNEIEVLKSNTIRESVAQALLDSFKVNPDKSRYYHILNHDPEIQSELTPDYILTEKLNKIISINQKRGLDIVEIAAESPSNYEAKLIANTFANQYLIYSLSDSRRELTNIMNFLQSEKDKRQRELTNSEGALQDYRQRGGVIFLDDQARTLVEQISEFEAQKNAADVELTSRQKAYTNIKSELDKVDPTLVTYLAGEVERTYVTELQKQIADLETKRDIESSIPLNDEKLRERTIADYNKKIEPLKRTLDEKVNTLKEGIYASTPEVRRDIAQRLLETQIEIQSLKAKTGSLGSLLGKYEGEFKKLPEQSIELAKLERNRKAAEKLYLTLEEKYQEAMINERAQLGNVTVIDIAKESLKPSKPNRLLILVFGILAGLGAGVGLVILRNQLDNSIKTPEEIERVGHTMLAWIPEISELKNSQGGLIVADRPSSIASESFKALRTRVLFSKLESEPLKLLLVTSSIPGEGKTSIASNLAGSFAQSDKKVLLIDCDLRKPRVHNVMQSERYPGLSDYLFSKVSYESIIKETKLPNLFYITSGTIPPNPSELLASKQMKDFLSMVKDKFDIIVLDSPPFISVTDAEILSRLTDGTVLVARANKTPSDAFQRVTERLDNSKSRNFLGTVLNSFSIKNGYGSYYNYYYSYAEITGGKQQTNGVNKSKNPQL